MTNQEKTIQEELSSLFENYRGGAVSIGNFDGVHIGHARLIERLHAHAEQIHGPAIVFTFDPHPAVLLNPDNPPRPLTWKNRKALLLGQLGVDVVLFFPTDTNFLEIPARDFFQEILVEQLQVKALVEGANFSFGKNREGNSENLKNWCAEAGVELEIVPSVIKEGCVVSSSLIRKLISEGNVDLANQMITQPYRIRGMVVHGDARGRTLGFPTANLEAIDTILPGDGAYAARVELSAIDPGNPNGGKIKKSYRAAVHIGPNATFNGHVKKVEVNIIDFSGDIYGKTLKVDFFSKIRNIVKFPDKKQLIDQLFRDRELVISKVPLNDARENSERGASTP